MPPGRRILAAASQSNSAVKGDGFIYFSVPSTTLMGEAVGTILFKRKPASSSSCSYSSVVRSWPPSAVSMTKSTSLPGCG